MLDMSIPLCRLACSKTHSFGPDRFNIQQMHVRYFCLSSSYFVPSDSRLNRACLEKSKLRVHHQLESLGGVEVFQDGGIVVGHGKGVQLSHQEAVVNPGVSIVVHDGCHEEGDAVSASDSVRDDVYRHEMCHLLEGSHVVFFLKARDGCLVERDMLSTADHVFVCSFLDPLALHP